MKLTPSLLKRIIREEKDKLAADKKAHEKDLLDVAKKTKEVDADALAGTLEKEIDHLAVLKIKEARVKRHLRKIQEAKKRSARRIKKLA